MPWAITRNNDLLIKGSNIKVSWGKYSKGLMSRTSNDSITSSNIRTKVHKRREWKPVFRDGRSYKEVTNKKPAIQVHSDLDLVSWLKKSMVCYYKESYELKEGMKEMMNHGFGDLILSKFDSKTCVISKRIGIETVLLIQEAIKKLKLCFNKVVPWSKISHSSLKGDLRSLAFHYTCGVIIIYKK